MHDYNNISTAASRPFGQNQQALVKNPLFCPNITTTATATTTTTTNSANLMNNKLPNNSSSIDSSAITSLSAPSTSTSSTSSSTSTSSTISISNSGMNTPISTILSSGNYHHHLASMSKPPSLDISFTSTTTGLSNSLTSMSCNGMTFKDPKLSLSAPSSQPYYHGHMSGTNINELGRVPDNPHTKPNLSYRSLISQAIFLSQRGKLTLASIYKSIAERHPYYRMSEHGWQNSIRHNLTLGECFVRVPREPGEGGKGSYWIIHKDFYGDIQADGTMKRSRAKGPVNTSRSRKRSSKISSTPSTPLLTSSSSTSSSRANNFMDSKTKKRRVISAPEFASLSERVGFTDPIGHSLTATSTQLRPIHFLSRRQPLVGTEGLSMNTATAATVASSQSQSSMVGSVNNLSNPTIDGNFSLLNTTKLGYPTFSLMAATTPFNHGMPSSTGDNLHTMTPTAMMSTAKYDHTELVDPNKLRQQLNSYGHWLPSFSSHNTTGYHGTSLSSILASTAATTSSSISATTTLPTCSSSSTSIGAMTPSIMTSTAFSNTIPSTTATTCSNISSSNGNSNNVTTSEANLAWSEALVASNAPPCSSTHHGYPSLLDGSTSTMTSNTLMLPVWHDYNIDHFHASPSIVNTTVANAANTIAATVAATGTSNTSAFTSTGVLAPKYADTMDKTASSDTATEGNDSIETDSLSDLVKLEDMLEEYTNISEI